MDFFLSQVLSFIFEPEIYKRHDICTSHHLKPWSRHYQIIEIKYQLYTTIVYQTKN